jgi:hypothetical protein
MRMLDERMTTLESSISVPAATEIRDDTVVEAVTWARLLGGLIDAPKGRTAVAECRDGALVAGLSEHGFDCYGVEPRDDLGRRATLAGVEVRIDDGASHLRRVDDGALAAVVLAGCVDVLPLNAKIDLLHLAVRKTAPDGVVVVLSREPARWREQWPVIADLAPGHPLQAETWQQLLAEVGLRSTVEREETSFAVIARR